MKTPITDKAFADAAKVNPSPSLMKLGIVSRRLELDRAALMEAIAEIDPWPEEPIGSKVHDGAVYCEISVGEVRAIRAALSAARANFPD